jgi:hypothetical protein
MPAVRPATEDPQRFVGRTPRAIVCDPPYNTVCPGAAGIPCVTIIPRHRAFCVACQIIDDQTGASTS